MSEFAKLFLGMGTLIAAARTGLRKTLTAVRESDLSLVVVALEKTAADAPETLATCY